MERYKISPAQIYSITCDNARNMVKMVDLFNENSENNDEPVDDTDVRLQLKMFICLKVFI